MKIIEIVEQLRKLPTAYVDCGFLQGRDAVLKQFQQHDEENRNMDPNSIFYEIDHNATVDQFISSMQDAIKELVKRAAPREIPNDYLSFLEYYGGLMIDGANYNFSMYGMGPRVEEWYGYLNTTDHVLMEVAKLGWLSLGDLVFRAGHKYDYLRVAFFLDLAGTIHKDNVIGVGPWDGNESAELMLSDLQAHVGKWKKVANSFIEWMELAVRTNGEFGYP